MNIFDRILQYRGITEETKAVFLFPKYEFRHDPFLLPDMQKVVDRLVQAREAQDRITIYGDYDIDGLTATTVLLDALKSFGFEHVDAFIPNRFIEGYGLTVDAVEKIATTGTQLIVTVDCGSLSHKEIIRAKELDMDVIVTDHHNVAPEQPPAIGVVNPKRLLQDYPDHYDHYVLRPDKTTTPEGTELYPFLDLAGVGVAFKLVQALQTKLEGLPNGQEKWLLDLVALGTVCDVVTLVDENRTNVFWGLKVLAQTRRQGLKALMAVSAVKQHEVTARSLGFGLGPRMNASGRLETAQHTLNLLTAVDPMQALEYAQQLDTMNQARRKDQDAIFKEAIIEAEQRSADPVLVVSAEGWNHGIVGIVAAKLLERYKKPTYVLSEHGEEAKGSARSYGDFSAADAIRAADDIITKGGGHKLAAGVTMPVANIEAFRKRVNDFYRAQNFRDQPSLLLPTADTDAALEEIDLQLLNDLATLEPFGSGNPQPIIRTETLKVMNVRRMGDSGQHVKLTVRNEAGKTIDLLAFSAPEHYFVDTGTTVTVWYAPELNDWMGRRSVEGRLLHLVVH